MKNNFKRKVISKKECLHDLESQLQTMFKAFSEAVKLFEQEIIITPIASRAKNFEASYLNSKMMQCIQKYFPANWKFGKYKRFILRINGYNVLFKKLNSKDMPMNVKTVLSDAIANQLQYSLFNDSPEVADPIVFFGYRKDKFGNIISPKLVYIDENHVKWVIDSADIEAQNIIPITQKNSESLLKIKKRDSEEKMAN
ncbi:hypothetical protein DMB45_00330 [Sanguibacteroides justesenii]|uniref:hypothetical protein n=1 Tax=Sanguibacteroides justesenii TaxID=1547597 RepID=UPI000D923B23|nr:hypothetical protein [Sanguibacteroides justesenii]PXZ44930.1 hypothetical protein DMB45_00330 [Sanguibacteroides justesenii]